MIIKTAAGQLFRVTETGNIGLAHVWNGVAVKYVAGHWSDELNTNVGPSYVPKKKARVELVRKAGCRLVAEDNGHMDSEGYPIGWPRTWSASELNELRRRERACDNYG
jgi:hypothetical protein